MLRTLLFIIGLLFGASSLWGQDFRFKQYRVENGLPGDLIKAVTQDSLGFFWIATDDGLVRYDGYQFKTFKPNFLSQYIKSFLHTSDGRLLVAADLELTEIISRKDTVIFKRLLRGARNTTDTTIWYPKLIYEDKKKAIWLSEPQSIVRVEGTGFKRYDFGIDNRSPVFTRAYSFFEDEQGNLYTASFQGKVFRYSTKNDSFELLPQQLPFGINHITTTPSGIFLASRQGAFQILLEEGGPRAKPLWPSIKNVSNLHLKDSVMWICTDDKNLFRATLEGEELERIDFDFDRVEEVYFSTEDDLWISTQRGLVLAQKNIFKVADRESQYQFVEAIAEDEARNEIYYCNREELVSITPTGDEQWKRKVVSTIREGYFQAIACRDGRLWATNDFSVLLFESDKFIRSWDFPAGRFINDVFLDTRNNLWLSQASIAQATVISADLQKVSQHAVPLLPGSNINLIRQGHHGMYAASNGKTGYLFFKPDSTNDFRNVSVPLSFEPQSDFNVTDFVIQNQYIWLATTEGLLQYDGKKIERVDLGEELTNFSVSSVEVYSDSAILFSNPLGLLKYNSFTKEYRLFDEASGLPSNTITARGIFVDHDRTVWVGTSMGLASAKIHKILKKTQKPYLVQALVNGVSKSYNNKLYAPYGTLIDLYFSSVTFPENKIIMQWREPEVDSAWRSMKANELALAKLTSGMHYLQVRAKKNTGQGWSNPETFYIEIGKPFWFDINFILFIILLAVIISLVSYGVGIYLMNQRRRHLEALIQHRTQQLQTANDELTLRNTELDRFVYSASHDLSAPLKSIRGLINITKMEKPEPTTLTYLNMMEQTVKKLEHFISEVVSYSRNVRMPVKLEEIDFTKFVNTLLEDHQFAPDFGLIHFQVENFSKRKVCLDSMRLKIILNNLISNAIKFHRPVDEVEPRVLIQLSETEDEWKLLVQDNGRGISPQHVSNIFSMFYRAHETSAGSGLGLYIMKEAVEKMGGRVSVQSEENLGTTFTIFCPKSSVMV